MKPEAKEAKEANNSPGASKTVTIGRHRNSDRIGRWTCTVLSAGLSTRRHVPGSDNEGQAGDDESEDADALLRKDACRDP